MHLHQAKAGLKGDEASTLSRDDVLLYKRWEMGQQLDKQHLGSVHNTN